MRELLPAELPVLAILWGFATLWIFAAGVPALRRQGVTSGARAALILSATLVALYLGSRLHYALANLAIRTARALIGPGTHVPGGIVLAIGTGVLLCRFLRVNAARFGDAIIPVFGIFLLFIRLGCLWQGCCFGRPSDLPWALRFPPNTGVFWIHSERGWLHDDATASLAVHPTQIYFAAAALLAAWAALRWRLFRPLGQRLLQLQPFRLTRLLRFPR